MTSSNRPGNAAPGGMGGATRMYDPSEAAHDRTRRRLMNLAFVIMVLATFVEIRWVGAHGCTFLEAVLLLVAGVPLGLGVKTFELRFKMATAERQAVLRELPIRRKLELVAYGLLACIVIAQQSYAIVWPLWGVWIYDFVTYYHDRPERIRHLYAVTKIIDELRHFPAPWAWTFPALAWEIFRMTTAR
ncbi:MAG TPA: hypothetical protein VMP11_06420 [Verrucomicrobiae bacterium]|nr:hypothetical protein [Verrucomicrobiae bacterium]